MRNSRVCLNYYYQKFGNDDIDQIFEIISNERKREKRRTARLSGVIRDRTRDNNIRRNISERTRKINYELKLLHIYEISCVFCKSLNGEFCLPEDENELVGQPGTIHLRYDDAYWICKCCRDIKASLLNQESLVEELSKIQLRQVDDMKNIVGLVQYENGK